MQEMITLENIIFSACCLALLQWGARIGVPRRAFSSSESFVLGHWPFLFLNLVILFHTGGNDWTALTRFDPKTLTTAQWVVALGLVGFLIGGISAVSLWSMKKTRILRLEAGDNTVLRVGIFLAVIGLAATLPNVIAMRLEGPQARSTALLAIGELLIPGVLLCYLTARNRNVRIPARFITGVLSVVGVAVLLFRWSRRPLLVSIVGILLLGSVRRRGFFDRRLLFVAAPALLALAVLALIWRNVVVYDYDLSQVTLAGIATYYADVVWLEASAFSALMLVIQTHGLFEADGGGSLLLPLIFWIPRAIFPAKPEAFDLAADLGTPYNIGPSIYGEALANLTILGLVPFMALLGFGFKTLDIAACRRRLSGPGPALYILLLLDIIFLVRGYFHTMLTPITLHFLGPLVLFKVDQKIMQMIAMGRARPEGKSIEKSPAGQ